jgi:predicted dienelactone hydrolase
MFAFRCGTNIVKAIVVAAPGLGFTLTPAALAGVEVPVHLWVGEKDDKVPYATNAKYVADALGSSVEIHSVPKRATCRSWLLVDRRKFPKSVPTRKGSTGQPSMRR